MAKTKSGDCLCTFTHKTGCSPLHSNGSWDDGHRELTLVNKATSCSLEAEVIPTVVNVWFTGMMSPTGKRGRGLFRANNGQFKQAILK